MKRLFFIHEKFKRFHLGQHANKNIRKNVFGPLTLGDWTAVDGVFPTNFGLGICTLNEFRVWVTQQGNEYSQLRDQCLKCTVTYKSADAKSFKSAIQWNDLGSSPYLGKHPFC